MKLVEGKVWTFGDLVDTDLIIPHAYLTTANPEELVKHAFESIYENFYKKVKKGDIIVAGRNFGTGSSREEAVYVIKQMGIKIVIADSIARIFYRNLINLGVYAIQLPGISKHIKNGEIVTVNFEKGVITNTSSSQSFNFQPFPDYISNIINFGGTINYLKARLRKH